jgi:hypothetical protein
MLAIDTPKNLLVLIAKRAKVLAVALRALAL